jgi:predicted transcriptional regulator
MTAEIEVHVEDDVEAMARRFVSAWHRAERGEALEERHLSFESWDGLARLLTAERLAVLRHLHRHPTASIAALARALGSDHRRVQDDVEALVAAGLIEHDAHGLRVGYSEIRATIAV